MPVYKDSQGNFTRVRGSKTHKKPISTQSKKARVIQAVKKEETAAKSKWKERSSAIPAISKSNLDFKIQPLSTGLSFEIVDCSGSVVNVHGYTLNNFVDLLVKGDHPNDNLSYVYKDKKLFTTGCKWKLSKIRKAGKTLVKSGNLPVSPFALSYRQIIKMNQEAFDAWLKEIGYTAPVFDEIKDDGQVEASGMVSTQARRITSVKVEDVPEPVFEYLTLSKTLEKVDGDSEAAEAFLVKEEDRPEGPRKGHLKALKKIVGQ